MVVQISLGKLGCARTVQACCARGRAHSSVVYPAALAVTSRLARDILALSRGAVYSKNAVKQPSVNVEEKIDRIVGRRTKTPDALSTVVKDDVLFFSADGQFRSKIGINPRRSKSVLGSYDAANRVLTIVQFTQPRGVTDYVNSLWKIQDNPFGGDAANTYNDGVPSPGAKPLGPFYELESSSPAAALAPGQSLTHVHRTMHLTGSEASLDAVAKSVLGVSLAQIQSAFQK